MEYTDNLRLQYVTSPATLFKDLWPLLEVNWKIIDTAVSGKQEALTFDSAPTNNSTNPVTSGGVYTALSGKQDNLTFDNVPTQDSANILSSGAIYAALSEKQDTLTFDGIPVQGSQNAITSGAVYLALQRKPESLTAGPGTSIQNGVISVSLLILTTYSDLVALRDSSSLVPGARYRITDYQCTTVQENTQSARHQFDIIVIADGVNVLNENARAVIHDGDTYFANNNLAAWELKYCIDNDTTRFAWASTSQTECAVYDGLCPYVGTVVVNGVTYYEFRYYEDDSIYSTKRYPMYGDTVYVLTNGEMVEDDTFMDYRFKGTGVIYYMKDEFNNECPYDFKNIQFKRKINLGDGYPKYDKENGTDTWVYTFTANSLHVSNNVWSELKDGSLESPYGHESDENTGTYHDNIIKPYIKLYDDDDDGDYTKYGMQYLNDNVFLGYYEEVGSDDPKNDPYYYAYCSYGCKLGLDNYSNTFGKGCNNNVLGNDCGKNILGENCNDNTFGNYCHDNTLGGNCFSDVFGNSCDNNNLGESCNGNTFGNHCQSTHFGNYCSSNILGNYCLGNALLGNYCSSNTFGNYCEYNYFGAGGFGGSTGYCRYNVFDNGCSYIYFYSTDNYADSSNYLQNVHIHLGVKGSSTNNRLSITVPDRNLAYESNYVKTGSVTTEI